jgi:hypothetical protein
MNYKDTKPYMSAFLSVDLLTEFAAFCLTDFIDWRYIHSWFVFSTQLVNCCPHGRRNYMVLPFPMYCEGVVGGVEMYCGPYSAGVLHSVFDQIQNLQNCFTTPNKNATKDDIEGLVSLKFLRPWLTTLLHLHA